MRHQQTPIQFVLDRALRCGHGAPVAIRRKSSGLYHVRFADGHERTVDPDTGEVSSSEASAIAARLNLIAGGAR